MDAADPILDPVYGMESNGLRILHASDANGFPFTNVNVYANTHTNTYVYAYAKRNVHADTYANTDADSICPGWTGSRRKFVGRGASRRSVRGICR